MYEWAGEALEQAGYEQYEISNWAVKRSARASVQSAVSDELSVRGAEPSYACQHNLQYWRARPYLGLGAGAHGYANGYRYSNVLRIQTYIERLLGDGGGSTGQVHPFPLSAAAVNQHRQSVQDDMPEFMITRLRLTREGIELGEFRRRFGRELSEVYGREIEELKTAGLLEAADGSAVIRLTKRGRLLGNQVFVCFV
jgi:oxygen-independent coproporphyrinogen-3 oxidase